MATTGRKTVRDQILELETENKRFPEWQDCPEQHKIGHAKRCQTKPGTFLKVRCGCPVPHWITKVTFNRKGKRSGKYCFICGAKRVVIQTV